MIKYVAILDDTDSKRETIKGYIDRLLPEAEVYEFSFINEGLCFLAWEREKDIVNNPNEWLVVTDMVMPRFRDSRLLPDGGMQVLSELERKGFECPVIVASSMELDLEECQSRYEYVIGVVEESLLVYNLPKYEEILRDFI